MRKFITYTSIVCIIISSISLCLDVAAGKTGDTVPLLVGLFILFMPKKGDDERSINIRLSSAYFALVSGYAIKLLSTNLFSHHLIPLQLTDINYFLILVFVIATIAYYSRMYFTSN